MLYRRSFVGLNNLKLTRVDGFFALSQKMSQQSRQLKVV